MSQGPTDLGASPVLVEHGTEMASLTEARPPVTAPRRWQPWGFLLAVGALFMFGRTIQLVWQGTLELYVGWVGALLIGELVVNACAVFTTAWWALGSTARRKRIALRAVSATVLVHAARVLVFVLGRTGPWVDFDVRPERRLDYAQQWSWVGVWFAGAMASVSLLLLVALWLTLHRRAAKQPQEAPTVQSM